MTQLIEKCLEIISTSELDQLHYDWEYSTYCVTFTKGNNHYELKFKRIFFGAISDITLTDSRSVISENKISKSEFQMLKKSYSDRISELKKIKFTKVFPDIERENKLNKIIN
jgi:hypothetical protein